MTWKKIRSQGISFDEAIADIHSGKTQIERSINERIFYAAIFVLSFFALVGLGRIFELGWLKNDFYSARAESNINRHIPIIAPRGIITDRYGVPLVENKLIFSVFLRVNDMVKNNEKDRVFHAFKSVLGIPETELLEKLEKADLENVNDIIIAKDITREQTIKINTLNLASVSVQNDYKREYISPAFSHVVGYVNLPTKADLEKNKKLNLIDLVGRSGLESYYDSELKGDNGLEVIIKNPKTELKEKEIIREPKIGNVLKTTIDAELQKYFYDRLVYNTSLRGQTSAVGIALNPKTGEILSLISLPSYDANNIGRYLTLPTKPLFNRAISGIYNPGSTMKPLHAVAGLHEGVINTTLQIFTRGFIEVPNIYDPSKPSRFVDHYCCGWLNVHSAIAASSNVYFYASGGGLPSSENNILRGVSSLPTGVGIERLNEYWRKFGLADPTGIDLPAEGKSFLPNPREKEKRTNQIWRVGDTYNVSIGQGDLAINMMQLANYVAAIANKGKVYKPHIAQREPEVLLDLSEFVPEFKEVEKGMVDSIYKPYGTSYSMRDVAMKVAAKTGTAQTNFNTRINALFVGYGPVEDPEIEVVVLIENAKEGSLNAIPIAKDVFNWYYAHRLTNDHKTND